MLHDDCPCCECEDEYVPEPYDPNHVWHGPRTSWDQFMADTMDALIGRLLRPIQFFDRFAGPPGDGKTVTFQVVSSETHP